MEKPEGKRRDLLLSNTITQDTVRDIVKEILEINYDDDQKEQLYANWERKPIKLYINSAGGSIYDGLSLVDIIKNSKTPVHTICIGSCMSMGLWVYLAGNKRYIGKNGTLMFHDISIQTAGKSEELKQDLNEGMRLQQMLVDEVVRNTKVKEVDLQDFIKRKADWFISAEDAIFMGFAEDYYE